MRRTLNDTQQGLLDYLIAHPQLITTQSQREASIAAGFPSHQSFGVALTALALKGYLVVDPEYLKELKKKE